MTDHSELRRKAEAASCVTCADHDEDCDDLPDKIGCWLYDPAKGMCPYLRLATIKDQP